MDRLVYLREVVTLELDQEKCVGCGMCLQVCPHAVFRSRNGTVEIGHRDACMECGACARNCLTEAISVKAGVGCATAVINSALGRRGGACCCTLLEDESPGAPAVRAGEKKISCCG
jgi:ferredoxin